MRKNFSIAMAILLGITFAGCEKESYVVDQKVDIETVETKISVGTIKASPMEFDNGTEVTLTMEYSENEGIGLGDDIELIYMIDNKDVALSKDKDKAFKAAFVAEGLTYGQHVISAKIKTQRGDKYAIMSPL